MHLGSRVDVVGQSDMSSGLELNLNGRYDPYDWKSLAWWLTPGPFI